MFLWGFRVCSDWKVKHIIFKTEVAFGGVPQNIDTSACMFDMRSCDNRLYHFILTEAGCVWLVLNKNDTLDFFCVWPEHKHELILKETRFLTSLLHCGYVAPDKTSEPCERSLVVLQVASPPLDPNSPLDCCFCPTCRCGERCERRLEAIHMATPENDFLTARR